jgi:magnesium transporter
VTDGLYSETHDLQQAAVSCIQNIVSNQNGLSDGPLVDIRHIQNATSEMESRVKRYMSSLERALDDDERLALLNLTRMMTHPERFLLPAATTQVLEDEGSEPSLILEGHLEMAYTLQNTLVLIKGQIDSASELIDRKQDAARNKILLANTIVSIFSLCVGYASLVGSIFGMNLMNHLEFNDSAWVIVVCVTIVTVGSQNKVQTSRRCLRPL